MKRTLYLWIIPLTTAVIGIIYIINSGLFFLRSVDPEYAYLINGLLLAQPHPNIQYTDHPGIPLQCLVAIVLRVVHLFRPGHPLVYDVLNNPEIYIRASLYAANCITAIVIFMLGLYTYRYSQRFSVAIFLQLTPFSHILIMESFGRIIPELMMCSIVCCWLVLLVRIIYLGKNDRNYKRYSVIFAILFGLGLADKMTFLPYFLLPLIILPSWKLRLKYTVISMVSFMLFALPVVLNHKAFLLWITNIFTHTGSYGGGERGIINWNMFADHLKLLVTNTRILLFSGIVLLLLTLFYVFMQKKHKRIIDFPVNIVFAVVLLLVIQYALAAKQFAFHYMVPALLLSVFIIFLIITLLYQLLPKLATPINMNWLFGFAGLLLLINMVPKIASELIYIKKTAKVKHEAYDKIAPLLATSPKIISPSYYGCSAKEYALTFGIHLSGRYGNFLTEKMEQLYPSTYLYFPWAKIFYMGNKVILPVTFIRPSTAYTLYIADYSTGKLKEILAALKTDTVQYSYTTHEIFNSPATTEAVFLLKINAINQADSVMKGHSIN
jgi:hypothetical protein